MSDEVLKVELNFAIEDKYAGMTTDERRESLTEEMASQGYISKLVMDLVSPFFSTAAGVVTDLVMARDLQGLKEFRTKMGAVWESMLEEIDDSIREILKDE